MQPRIHDTKIHTQTRAQDSRRYTTYVDRIHKNVDNNTEYQDTCVEINTEYQDTYVDKSVCKNKNTGYKNTFTQT